MANIDRFMIAPISTGQQNDAKPWMIPDDAFAELTNAYIFRGRVLKRVGGRLMGTNVLDDVAQLSSRLRVKIGPTDAVDGDFAAMPGGIPPIAYDMPGTQFKIGQMFSIGDTIFTVHQLNGAMLTTGVATGTFDADPLSPNYGFLSITGNNENPLTDVYFYPATPVMGILTRDIIEINSEETIAFDTQFAYKYSGTAWERIDPAEWTSSDSQFFTGCSWRGVDAQDFLLYVTNYNPKDLIKYYNGITWTDLSPVVRVDNTLLKSCRLLVTFKGRLLALNTIEGIGAAEEYFTSRCRFSQNGTPLITADVNAWREDITGKGGFLDAPTKEAIVSCAFIKDRLIVYFERSTWELASTQNQVFPFVWLRINSELGAESTLSAVPFDKVVLGMGQTGIHACNGANVERIDQKIPDKIFDISNLNEGVNRVVGIRDFFTQMVYWSYPAEPLNDKFPNRVLVYNYLLGSWAVFEDSITAFGYYQSQTNMGGIAIQDRARFRNVIAGNQQGFIFFMWQNEYRNSQSLQITNMTQAVPGGPVLVTAYNHNLTGTDYVYIDNVVGTGTMSLINGKIYERTYDTENTFYIDYPTFNGTYKGGGTIELVTPMDILTKEYNFYVDKGYNAYISKVDFYVDKTFGTSGQVSIGCFVGSSTYPLTTSAITTGSLLGTSILETTPYALVPFEAEMNQLWHPIYPQIEGELIQFRIYLSDAQIRNPLIAFENFELNAMTFYATPTASRLQ